MNRFSIDTCDLHSAGYDDIMANYSPDEILNAHRLGEDREPFETMRMEILNMDGRGFSDTLDRHDLNKVTIDNLQDLIDEVSNTNCEVTYFIKDTIMNADTIKEGLIKAIDICAHMYCHDQFPNILRDCAEEIEELQKEAVEEQIEEGHSKLNTDVMDNIMSFL
jgi:hypothetical protein